MATIAPVAVSVALWLVTGQVFALVFAALGPAVAIASVADARLQSRRRSRREATRFAGELAAAEAEVDAAHERERARLVARAPSAGRLLSGDWSESEQWLGGADEVVAVSLGRGERASTVVLDGMPTATRAGAEHSDALRSLAGRAATVRGVPVIVDARLGIGIVGPREIATAVARSVLLQVLATLPPSTHTVSATTGAGDRGLGDGAVALPAFEAPPWLESLPHAVTTGDDWPNCLVLRVTGPTANVLVAVARDRDRLPRGARIVVRAEGVSSFVEQHPDPSLTGALVVEPTSREQFAAVARRFAARAEREGLVRPGDLPASVAFDEVAAPPGDRDARPAGLACVVAATSGEPLSIDLVENGPHAIVGGTTGSGKSELLTAWILAIARSHSPRAVSVLLVDFKGGSAFAGLAGLPHCVGVLTDLDDAAAARALESLAAELRRRERLLAAVGAKSIDAALAGVGGPAPADGEPAVPPRLVIVVDEFAAMVSGFPELHALFGDIAARGRSLGVHLVLCTQRPAGVIRDAVLANSAIRISLRVNNRADSLAVIGTDAAATASVAVRGRALVSTDGGEPVLAQFPLVTADDIAAVRRAWAGHGARPHRPWLDPLPSVIERRALPAATADSRPFGVLDDPANQSQPVACYRPDEHGNLLVVGGAGSGKSTLLAAIAGDGDGGDAGVMVLPAGVEPAWDALAELAAAVRGAAPVAPRIVLVDDVDVLVARYPEEYEGAVLELVARCLREGPARGIRLVLTAQRLAAGLHPIAALCGSRLLLRLPSRQEFVLAGGDGSEFGERLPPGGGRWQGLRVQVARSAPAPAAPQPPSTVALDLSRPLAVVSNHPRQFADRLRRADARFALPGAVTSIGAGLDPAARHPAPTPTGGPLVVGVGQHAIVGDVEAWQAQWGALAALRATHTVVVDSCSAAELRSVTRSRVLPPPLDGAGGSFWSLDPDGEVRRTRLPAMDSAGIQSSFH